MFKSERNYSVGFSAADRQIVVDVRRRPRSLSGQVEAEPPHRTGRRTIMCMVLIAALAIIWNLIGH
jgi:hypothetical protein